MLDTEINLSDLDKGLLDDSADNRVEEGGLPVEKVDDGGNTSPLPFTPSPIEQPLSVERLNEELKKISAMYLETRDQILARLEVLESEQTVLAGELRSLMRVIRRALLQYSGFLDKARQKNSIGIRDHQEFATETKRSFGHIIAHVENLLGLAPKDSHKA